MPATRRIVVAPSGSTVEWLARELGQRIALLEDRLDTLTDRADLAPLRIPALPASPTGLPAAEGWLWVAQDGRLTFRGTANTTTTVAPA